MGGGVIEWWEALVLGLVQGLSEFLPVSSSGHLLLLEKLGVGEENLLFNICLHIGTLFAVLICMRKPLLALIKKPFQKHTGHILLACVPTVLIALAFDVFFEDLIGGSMLPLGFIITACALFAAEKLTPKTKRFLDPQISLLTGIAQGIAVLPGISRSGSTISVLRLLGVEKSQAAEFSFILSIPIILGSALFEIVRHGSGLFDSAAGGGALAGQIPAVLIGMSAAFVSGLFAITFFLKLLAKHSAVGFSVYTLALGIVSFFAI
jgi:undecaprenyl-diphosphatase